MKVLVINAGSSSIKYQLYDMPQANVLAKGSVERIGEEASKLSQTCGDKTLTKEGHVADHEEAMAMILEALVSDQGGAIKSLAEIESVGHRVVHGGEEFTGSTLIDEAVIASVEKFCDLAPLHNPHNLVGIRAAMHKLPNANQVACFDTAFHATIPEVAYMYALPYELYETYRIRRYGFHGTSHRYVARRAAELLAMGKYDVNVITVHLGNGCSMAAVSQGRSVDTSMGLTPLEGLVMGTRTGDFDPAILFYLADKGYDIKQLNTLCNKKSGLLGISGKSNDMRNLGKLAAQGDTRAQLAIDIFCYRVRKYIGTYAAVLDGVHAVVFTGGIGENSPEVRAKICGGLTSLGIDVDAGRNRGMIGSEGNVSTDTSRAAVLVIPTNEEQAIAKDTYAIVSGTEQ
ncbi:MAG: acetate kinase [Phycisphaerae bacterium]|nr:acetate kinase [Phycisphaerae bacterium]